MPSLLCFIKYVKKTGSAADRIYRLKAYRAACRVYEPVKPLCSVACSSNNAYCAANGQAKKRWKQLQKDEIILCKKTKLSYKTQQIQSLRNNRKPLRYTGEKLNFYNFINRFGKLYFKKYGSAFSECYFFCGRLNPAISRFYGYFFSRLVSCKFRINRHSSVIWKL